MKIENIIEFIKDPQLIGGDLSDYQETALRLLYGLPLDEKQKEIAKKALDTEDIPQREFNEATFVCGRRSGKSDRLASNVAVYEAVTGGHEEYLAPGERGHIVIIAQDRRGAGIVFSYIRAKFQGSPLLSQLIEDILKEEIRLTSNLSISVFPCNFRAPRGFAVPVFVTDELAFFRYEGANIDKEVLDSVRPGMATFPNSKLIKISSPYAKAGELYRDYATRHQRKDLLCFQAPSWDMNPSIPKSFLDSEKERDPEYFDREYGAQFSDSIANAFSREAVEACIQRGRLELPYLKDHTYYGAADPSGGGADEFSLSVCHRDGELIVQDCIRGWRSKRPADVVEEAAKVLKDYHISRIVGDRYSGEWVRQAFRDEGIEYEVSKLTASEAFLEFLPLVNQGSIELLDEKKQTAQLIALERRTSRTGKDSLGHPQGGHDDRANALALAAA
ncbi:hypothetical protein MYX82_06855, partial [Acidobacteria bacterium AH-259-D05]|nr:hypothetical protein [Acidobacteria bacterium AH-259-D05]